jgi:hypothetical protein
VQQYVLFKIYSVNVIYTYKGQCSCECKLPIATLLHHLHNNTIMFSLPLETDKDITVGIQSLYLLCTSCMSGGVIEYPSTLGLHPSVTSTDYSGVYVGTTTCCNCTTQSSVVHVVDVEHVKSTHVYCEAKFNYPVEPTIIRVGDAAVLMHVEDIMRNVTEECILHYMKCEVGRLIDMSPSLTFFYPT